MLDAPITPQIIAKMMHERGILPMDVEDQYDLISRMAETLIIWRVNPIHSPTDHALVRAHLRSLCKPSRSSYAALDAGFACSEAV